MAKARVHPSKRPTDQLLFAAALSVSVLLPLLVPAAATAAAAAAAAGDGDNKSALGVGRQWAAGAGKDEGKMVAEGGAGGGGSVEEDEFAGGFGSLDSMLQWAIGNSDPEKLKEEAADVQKLSADELLKRRQEIKELMEKLKMPSDADLMKIAIADLNNSSISLEDRQRTMLTIYILQELMEKLKMPSDADLMKIAIADLNNSSISLEDRQRALQELLVLVEPIDNANDLDKLGGLLPVIQELNNANEEIRTTSAWVLGTASQNNALVQNQILGYGALARLVKMGYSTSTEEAAKALYAISSLIRNNVNGQEAFHSENGSAMLQHILVSSSIDVRLQKKAVFLVTDLADFQLNSGNAQLPFLSDRLFLKSIIDMLSRFDLDLQEKVLLAIKSLLKLPSTDVEDFEFYDLGSVLFRLGVQLEDLTSEDQKEFAVEVDVLRREVQTLFQQKVKQGKVKTA